MLRTLLILLLFIILYSCQSQSRELSADTGSSASNKKNLVNRNGDRILSRFNTPNGYSRVQVKEESFGGYLRNLPLHPYNYKVHYYDGRVKQNDVNEAVLKFDVGNADLQQCADAVMRIRAEYFYQQKNYDSINFRLTNGFDVPFAKWIQGNKVKVNGNETSWVNGGVPGFGYDNFRRYMDFIFAYAGTLSLERSLHSKSVEDILPGDVFIQGGTPGHAVMVMDVAENENGDRIFLLAQSYMPAQEIQILKNFENAEISPWFRLKEDEELKTPEWNFPEHSLKTW